jgi:Fe-S-cluster containining protein
MPVTNRCQSCDAQCCRHIVLEIDEPTSKHDFENIRWYLCHQGTQVYKEDGKWYLQIHTRCRYLGQDRLCGNYENRPAICRSYQTDNCEKSESEFEYEVHLKSDADLEAYLASRKRGRA